MGKIMLSQQNKLENFQQNDLSFERKCQKTGNRDQTKTMVWKIE
jgi:hypothetical protein